MRKIIKFEKSDCNPCTMVSELLDKTGIQYEKVNPFDDTRKSCEALELEQFQQLFC